MTHARSTRFSRMTDDRDIQYDAHKIHLLHYRLITSKLLRIWLTRTVSLSMYLVLFRVLSKAKTYQVIISE